MADEDEVITEEEEEDETDHEGRKEKRKDSVERGLAGRTPSVSGGEYLFFYIFLP